MLRSTIIRHNSATVPLVVIIIIRARRVMQLHHRGRRRSRIAGPIAWAQWVLLAMALSSSTALVIIVARWWVQTSLFSRHGGAAAAAPANEAVEVVGGNGDGGGGCVVAPVVVVEEMVMVEGMTMTVVGALHTSPCVGGPRGDDDGGGFCGIGRCRSHARRRRGCG
jgi:hypothetical protein